MGQLAVSLTNLVAQSMQNKLWPQGTRAATTSDSQQTLHLFSLLGSSDSMPEVGHVVVAVLVQIVPLPTVDPKLAIELRGRSGVDEDGEVFEGEDCNPPKPPPVSAEVKEANDDDPPNAGAGSELILLAGACASRDGESLEDGGDAPDTEDDLLVNDDDKVEDKEENVLLREELELIVEPNEVPKDLPMSPHMLVWFGSNEGEDPMDDPIDPKPSSTPL